MQTSKSRFVYCLGPYIAAMISKGKRGAAGMAQFCCKRAGEIGGGAILAAISLREHGERPGWCLVVGG